MNNTLLDVFLEESEKMRPGYKESIRRSASDAPPSNIPSIIHRIYSEYSGTKYEIQDQKFMDFIPGYLLIHSSEYSDCITAMRSLIETEKESYFPILTNYASCFYAVKIYSNESEQGIYLVTPENTAPTIIHKDFKAFMNTQIKCYKSEAYFLDNDGFLDVDFDIQSNVGKTENLDIQYWTEEG